MEHTRWNRTRVAGSKVAELRSNDDVLLASFAQPTPEQADVEVLGHHWHICATHTEIRATLPDGRVYRAVPEDEGKKFSRSKRVVVRTDRNSYAVNEARQDWVYVSADAAEDKLGQFSGGNKGVRQAITEFEPDSQLSDSEKIFFSLVTRHILEARLDSTSLVLSISLLILTPVIILFAIL
ncbi:hypothetical protein [Corynebacterium sp. sy039]|uniref:hypothetical protein n=1 Tax=Corynebacterium sp. sy039 TaxID=2599641 RepID=UPI0011B7CA20|nr:hypothetical protein [Corynebacterium sp. sy039]QDZ43010.1 hypothetical protein FQV43_07420 [Corynebacterium sp. sy039]